MHQCRRYTLLAGTSLVILLADGGYSLPRAQPKETTPPVTFYGHTVRTDYGHPPRLNGCVVTAAHLVYNGKADAPLTAPREFNAPVPGQSTDNTGPAVGPEPGTTPQQFLTANVFEYHSDLSGKGLCASQQYVLDYRIAIDKTNGRMSQVHDKGLDDQVLSRGSAWPADRLRPGAIATHLPLATIFEGTTTTGKKTPIDGGTYYEGTPERIHWLDTPGWKIEPDPASHEAWVLLAVIKSETKGTNQLHGRRCFSGHTIVVDVSTGAPMAAAAVRTLFSSATGSPKAAVNTLRSTPAQGGFQGNSNPEFRDLGCYEF
jgi:hypothetical protein